ncbi:hypothetical protein MMC07_007712 [Pseudocyphellaria aurata]|nr:hypothetical protein [Pseudocyphellaria aurata]
MFDCGGGIWRRDDFTSCFQQDYLQFLFPLIASGVSFAIVVIQWSQRTSKTKRKSSRSLLNDSDEGIGRLIEYDGIADQMHHIERPPLRSSNTHTSVKEVSRPRGEMVVVVLEILAVAGEVGINLVALLTRAWGTHGQLAAIAGLVVWSYICTLTMFRLLLTSTRLAGLPRLWNHTAILYNLQWLFTVLLFRSAVLHPRSKRAQILMIADFVLATLLSLIAVTSRKGNKVVVLEYEGNLEPSRESLASLWSLATFGWVDDIVWQGYKKTFELADVWNLVPKDKAAAVLNDFRQLEKTSKLAWHLLRYFRRDLLIQALWAFISAFFTFVPTLLLKAILEYVEDPEATPANTAWFYLILLTVSSCVQATTDGQTLWKGRKICIRLRAVIIGEIYAKALRRKASAGTDTILGAGQKKKGSDKLEIKRGMKDRVKSIGRKKKTTELKAQEESALVKTAADSQVNAGTIINLMAVDSFKVSDISAYLHFLWINAPVLLIICIILLYRILGYSSFASIGLMILVMPINFFIARGFARRQKIIMAATDARIHTTNEVLQNIRIIKYFAWERRFAEIVDEKRRTELLALRSKYILWAFAATIWFGVPLLITFFSFLVYTKVEKKPLKPSVAFPALSLFGILRIPLDQFADMLAHVQESKVSVDRVEEFLNEDETEKYGQLIHTDKDDAGEPKIGFHRASFTWGHKDSHKNDGSTPFQLIDLDITFQVGQLNIVAGPTGSGKTSLLMALLGEMTLLSGGVYLPGGHSREDMKANPDTGLTESVAYCAQQAWLVNDTIKQNILFASPWDESRYQRVIAACSLERDLEILDNSDSTLVGEKGIALSGGQKQRISLARALYCNSRHVILDDCLSAVDSETARHLFECCIMGPLMNGRTCILVTHNIALCVPRSHHVVALANGKIAFQGPPDQVMASGALGEDVLQSKPTSGCGTSTNSPEQSTVDLISEPVQEANDFSQQSNGHAGAPVALKKIISNGKDEATDVMVESKAEGGVKRDVIRLYLSAMGPWYFWVFALFIFTVQQVGSIATNVWIRKWSNSYKLERASLMVLQRDPLMVSQVQGLDKPFASNCLSRGRCAAISPFLSNSASDTQFGAASDEVDVAYYLGGYALLAVIYLIISFARETLIFWGSLRASWKIHARLLESVTRAKFRFFDSTPLGQLMNRFSRDIEAIDQEVAPVSVGLLGCVFAISSIIVLISVITPGFLIAGVFIAMLYIAIGGFYLKSSRDLKRIESVQRSPLYQQFGETLSGIITIRAYRDERRFIRDNQNRVDTHNRPFIYLWATNRWLAFRVDIVGAFVAFFAGVFVISSVGKIDAGAAGLSLTYAVTFTENVLWLVRLYAVNEQNMNSVERVKEYLDVDQEAKAVIPETRPSGNWPSQGAIEFINYSTRYRSGLEPVLKNVTFSVRPGERVGIVGRTGAGKSSLALALFRGLEAEDGKILIDNVDIGLIGLQDLRESITMVPQDPTLFTGTIRSNLDPFGLFTDEEIFYTLRRVQLIETASSATPSESGTHAAAKFTPSESAEVFVDGSEPDLDFAGKATNTHENVSIFTNLESSVAESGSNLSQGQRQLLCLARALLKSPRVLLMDEATASIDYATDGKIQETLREVKESTIITIAHRLQTIIDYDKVLVLDKGQVVEYDSPWELISKENGIFRGMCEVSGHLESLVDGAKKANDQKKLIDV